MPKKKKEMKLCKYNEMEYVPHWFVLDIKAQMSYSESLGNHFGKQLFECAKFSSGSCIE